MIVSPRHRYVFVHIPKTGGTALALALEPRAAADDILIGDTPKALRRRGRLKGLTARGRLWKHSTLADIDGVVDLSDPDGWFVFAITRNPWDRVVSLYHWLRGQGFDHPLVHLARAVDFPAFAAAPLTAASLRAQPCAAYITDAAGVERCGMWLRHERLAQDVAALGDRLGWRLALPNGVNASGRGRDWRGYYDAPAVEAVAQACAADIARFGYGFDDAGRWGV